MICMEKVQLIPIENSEFFLPIEEKRFVCRIDARDVNDPILERIEMNTHIIACALDLESGRKMLGDISGLLFRVTSSTGSNTSIQRIIEGRTDRSGA